MAAIRRPRRLPPLRGAPRNPWLMPLLLCGFAAAAFAQTPPPDAPAAEAPPPSETPGTAPGLLPALRDRALVLRISTRVPDGGGEVWNSAGSKVTLPGRPVGLKLTGGNMACSAQFTPYVTRSGEVILVAQGQIWLEIPGRGLHYETIVKTIPVKFDEQVYFFPLGPAGKDGPQLEIRIEMKRYARDDSFNRE